MGMGFGAGTYESQLATRMLSIVLDDDSMDIRIKTANALMDWGQPEPATLHRLERIWNGPTNQTHLGRLYKPSLDGLAVWSTMKDIFRRFPQVPISDAQRAIVEMKI